LNLIVVDRIADRAMSLAHGLRFNTHQTKVEGKDCLCTVLLDEYEPSQPYASFLPAECEVFLILHIEGGMMPRYQFAAPFDRIRPDDPPESCGDV
jgi:hypothetical protein